MVLRLDDGFKIILDRNSKVRVTPSFIKLQKSSIILRWIQLLSGKIRANIINENKRRIDTKFRTNTVSMGVRGTDFAIIHEDGKSQVITIEGEVAVKNVSTEEDQVFEKLSEAAISGNMEQAEVLSSDLGQLTPSEDKEIIVEKCEIVEALTPPAPEVLATMDEAQQKKLIDMTKISSPKPVNRQEIAQVKELTRDLELAEDSNQKKAVEEIIEKIEQKDTQKEDQLVAKKEAFFNKRFSIGFAVFGDNFRSTIYSGQTEYQSGGHAFIFEYRPYPFLSLEFATGKMGFEISSWDEAFAGKVSEDSKNEADHSYLGIGYWKQMDNLRFGLKLGHTSAYRFSMTYSAADSSEKIADLEISSGIRGSLRAEWAVFRNPFTTFFELGSSLGRRLIRAKEQDQEERSAPISSVIMMLGIKYECDISSWL